MYQNKIKKQWTLMPLYKYVISEYQESIIINKQTRYIG